MYPHLTKRAMSTTRKKTLQALFVVASWAPQTWSRRGIRPPDPLAWEAVQTLVPFRPLVSASVYFIGSGDDSWVPRTSAIVPLRPSAWLQFGYSVRRLF